MSAEEAHEVEEVAQTTETAVAAVNLGNYSDKELRGNILFARIMQLVDTGVSADGKDKTKWIANSKETEGCKIEQLVVDYCKMKAVRISTNMNCSLATFQKVLADDTLVKEYDPDLNKMEVLEKKEHSAVVYTNYVRRSRFIAPRDFVIEGASKVLNPEEAVAEKLTASADNLGAFVQNSTSVPNLKPLEKDWTRGTIYAFGYVAVAVAPNKIHVTNYNVVDPSGKIPAMVADAAASLSAKKIATIRSICEKVEKQQ